LQKAFTHWRVCAFDEVERTSIARRHIIRTRTFNAWREITVVNELKVRRQVIKKFFSIWKRQHNVIGTKTETALQRFEGNLVEKSYRKWVQKGWDIKASLWWAEDSKQRILARWALILRHIFNDYNVAEDHHRLQLLRKTWQTLKARTDESTRKEQQAVNVYQLRICSNAFRRWRGETQVIPAKIAVQTDVSSRLLRETFGIWLHRSREERRAVAIDRSRILREAWTTWRHKVRFQVTRARVNDRVVQVAMYKWLLGARIIFTERKFHRNVLRNCWGSWVHKSRLAREQRWNHEDQAEDFATRNAQGRIVSRWRDRIEYRMQREADASDLYKANLLRKLVPQWSERTRYLRQLHSWSRDAQFYFLASKTLKRWKCSTESAKREKRKAAYVQVRRVTKMNLARGILLGWRQQAQRVIELQAQAQEMSQNKNVIVGMNIFDRWRARAEELAEFECACREKVLRKQFIVWRDRSSAFQDLEVEAIINYHERQQSRAVKKWSLLTLQLRSRSLYAGELRDKNVKRTFRKTFSYWHQRTLQKRPFLRAEIEQKPPGQLGATARAETWSDFGDEGEVNEWARGLSDANPSTPIPGYLSTPSKRMERVSAAAARFSSTTPRAPLSTPFERHLRAQYSGDGLLSARNPPGRSRLGMGAGFPDIADTDRR
jgi:protein SFI1